MNSLSSKIEKLRSIASSLGLQGESVEAIIQMLGYALHTSEVEHIAYSQEATLERATNINSKIQHCVNMMYSVYRGSNPRVIITMSPTKRFIFNPGDLVAKSNNFNIYYLGYWDENLGEFVESGTTIYPGGEDYTRTILCVLSKYELEYTWKITSDNLYYETIKRSRDKENVILSSDCLLFISDEETSGYNQVYVTRRFSEHERKNQFFDLTLPGFGLNIYYPSKYENIIYSRQDYSDKWMKIKVQEFMEISSININELKQLKIQGSIPKETPTNILKTYNNLDSEYSFPSNGLIYIKETSHDNIESIHYLANKNRYTGSYLATNSDLSFLLAEAFPNKVKQENGVTCIFNEGSNDLVLYYVPSNTGLDITSSEKSKFIGEQGSYYITKNIDIRKATKYNANIILDVELYSMENLTEDISNILQSYQNRLNVDLGDEKNQTPDYLEIKSLISKLSNVKYIKDMRIEYFDSFGNKIDYEDIKGSGDSQEDTNYSDKYFTIEALEDGTLKFDRYIDETKKLSYSLDDGLTWKIHNNTPEREEVISVKNGDIILFKGNLDDQSDEENSEYIGVGTFVSSGKYNASGNILSLVYSDNFKDKDSLPATFMSLFSKSKIVDAGNLILPSVTSKLCYSKMFDHCGQLKRAPKLPAKELSESCYSSMFSHCISLIMSPSLPATVLDKYCYSSMFSECSSLTSAPKLPAIFLKESCYESMFADCNSLVNAPELNATTLDSYCYKEMFKGCTSLTIAPALNVKDLKEGCYMDMFKYCSNLVRVPELPATELKESCYYGMFNGCEKIERAPILPAGQLADNCYTLMFNQCENLVYIKAMFLDDDALRSRTLNNWTYGVYRSGQFVISPEASFEIIFGNSAIPSGWNIIREEYSESESIYNYQNGSNDQTNLDSDESEEIETQNTNPYYFYINCEINSAMS